MSELTLAAMAIEAGALAMLFLLNLALLWLLKSQIDSIVKIALVVVDYEKKENDAIS